MIMVNGFKIEPTMFSDKTSQVRKLPESLIGSDLMYEYIF